MGLRIGDPGSSSGAGQPPWFLVEVSGNLSSLFSRHSGFIQDLKDSIANLTDTEPEQVQINQLSYTPSLLVNLSLGADFNTSTLDGLVDSELADPVFKVISVTSQDQILVPQEYLPFKSFFVKDNLFVILCVVLTFLVCLLIFLCILSTISSRRQRLKASNLENQPIFYTNLDDEKRSETSVSNEPIKLYHEDFDLKSEYTSFEDNESPLRSSRSSDLDASAIPKKSPFSASPQPPDWKRTKPPLPPRSDSLWSPPRGGRPLSVPVPCHMSSALNQRPASCATMDNNLSKEVIDEDVSYILSTLDVNEVTKF